MDVSRSKTEIINVSKEDQKPEEKKYILCRREIDGVNEVIKAGPNARTAVGLVDFKVFIKRYGFHPLELAQFLKINYWEIKLLMDYGGWIDIHAQNNLIQLTDLTCPRGRRDICRFLMNQDGSAGSHNFPQKESKIDHAER